MVSDPTRRTTVDERRGEPEVEAVGLIGIYDARETADSVASELQDDGADAHVVTSDTPEGDEVIRLALLAEQQEDAAESKSSAQVAPAYPKEAAKGLAIVAPILVTGFVIVATALSFLLLPDQPVAVRLLIGIAVGAFGGGAMSLVIGPAIAAPRPGTPAAAQRGVLVWSRSWNRGVEETMVEAEPIRLDRRLGGGEFESVITEDRSEGTGVVDEIRRNTVDAPQAGNDWQQGGPDALADRDTAPEDR